MRREAPGGEARAGRIPAWRRTRAGRAVVLVLPSLLLLALLGLAEVALRLALPQVETLDVFVQSSFQRDDFSDAENVRIFEGDPLLFWRLKPNLDRVVWDFTVVSTDAQGLRRAGPVAHQRGEGARILCLGDSVTFGYRVPLVFPAAPDAYDRTALPFPEILEQRLRAANPGRAVEVLNMGVPGYTSRQGHAWLTAEIGRLRPDLVVICFGWNDIALRESTDPEAMSMGRAPVLARRVASRSQLLLRATLALRAVRRRLPVAGGPGHLVPRLSQDEAVQETLASARLARAHGSAAVIVAPIYGGLPDPGDEALRLVAYRAALTSAARGEGFPVLAVRELTEAAFPANKHLFPVEPIHPGPLGHRLLAEALLRLLEDERILTSPRPGAGASGRP